MTETPATETSDPNEGQQAPPAPRGVVGTSGPNCLPIVPDFTGFQDAMKAIAENQAWRLRGDKR